MSVLARRPRAVRWMAWAAGIIGLLTALYALAGFLLLPWVIEHELAPGIERRLGLTLTLDGVRANPFLLRLDADGIALAEHDGTPLLQARRARVDLDFAGLLRRIWTIGAVELEGAKVQLMRGKDGRFELPSVVRSEPDAAPAAAPHGLPAFQVRRLALHDGTIVLLDRNAPSSAIPLERIQLDAESLATAADAPAGRYRLAASLPGGGSLEAEGEIGIAARSSSGRVAIGNAPLEPWWPLLKQQWPVSAPGGRLSFGAHYITAEAGLVLEALTLHGAGLTLARADAAETDLPLVAIDRIDVSDGGLDLGSRRLSLKGVRLTDGTLSATLGQDGRIDWAGLLPQGSDESPSGEPWHVELPAATLDGVALHYRELAEPRLHFDADRAEVRGDFLLDGASGGFRATALGASLARPRYSVGDAPLVTADRIELSGGALDTATREVVGERIVFDRPEARLIIDRNRQLNLADILHKRPAGASPSETARTSVAAPAYAVRVERIEIHDGSLDFADESLVLPFSTRVESVTGHILGIDNRPRSEAVVSIGGRVAPHGEAHAEGRIRPFAPGELTDLSVRFDNVEMPQLSPYSATFAGRKIAAGKLWLNVNYRIFDRQLDGNNAVTLENFVLGERVEAPNARDLPLELAVALLKDTNGRVHLEVPVRGHIGDAHFEYGRLVTDALGNVLTRIVTAPFRFLAGLVGRDDDALQAVIFEAGSARLSSGEEEKLQQLARALGERPQLVLTVHGSYLAGEDEKALRTERTRREIATAAGRKPGGGPVGDLDFGNTSVRAAVSHRFTAEAGSEALTAFRRDFARRSPDGGETALHRELFDRLVEFEPLKATALDELARERTAAVLDYLRMREVPAKRLKADEPGSVQTGEPRAELALEASAAVAAAK